MKSHGAGLEAVGTQHHFGDIPAKKIGPNLNCEEMRQTQTRGHCTK